MLIPDCVHPEQTIYYNGAFVLEAVQELRSSNILELYERSKKGREMSIAIFLLSLDWLYLINAIKISELGLVELCS